MLSAAVRVLARTAAIQLEEIAAASRAAPASVPLTRSIKGKERARDDFKPNVQSGPAGGEVRNAARALEVNSESREEFLNQSSRSWPTAQLSSAPRAARLDSNDLPILPEGSTPIQTTHTSPPDVDSDSPVIKEDLASDRSRQGISERSAPDLRPKAALLPLPLHPSPTTSAVQAATPTSESSTSTPQVPPDVPGAESRPKARTETALLGDHEQPVPPAIAATESTVTAPEETDDEEPPVLLRASKVPSSRIGRLFHYGSLAASLGWGAASESVRRATGGQDSASTGSVFMSDANVRRLVGTLGRMRGAALKLGQFMSIQDNHMLPPEIEKVLQQVQAHANYMPDWQMEKVMATELGADWQSLFSQFDRTPIASASIGQVHRAILSSDHTPLAIKVQFPGIASSISSDLANLSVLLRSSALLPKGLYLQNTIAVMRRELEDECDYRREAEAGRRFGKLLEGDEFFRVPKVIDEASSDKVLGVEWMEGRPLSKMKGLSQETRDKIGYNILRLCLLELFQFRFMQTDPNWANFLFDPKTSTMGLIDFGASREYTKEFMDGWYRLLKSCLVGDREVMKRESEALGYLTGEESEVMVNAHLDSMALVASPFSYSGPYPFATQNITSSVRALIPIMLQHRLTPPPPETYSLNRKLSGAFLMCAKLEARVDCQHLWEDVVGGYKEGPEEA